jgi:hypothetical protein
MLRGIYDIFCGLINLTDYKKIYFTDATYEHHAIPKNLEVISLKRI